MFQDLDTLLYAWLSAPDERSAEHQFTRYFRAAFPEMCRFLRSFRADAGTAEDISQQALIKLFAHLGTQRKAADVRLREALSVLAPLAFGALHVRLVQGWREQVGGYRDAALRFSILHEAQESGGWRELRDEINGRAEPLQRQGTHFVRDVCERIGTRLDALIVRGSADRGIEEAPSAAAPPQPGDTHGEVPIDAAQGRVASFVAALLQYAASRDSQHVDTALGCAGAVGFVTRTSTVCECLPVLAIPSNGLLYTIAKRLFLDSLRSKRPHSVELTAALAEGASQSVLDEWDAEDNTAIDSDPVPEAQEWTSLIMSGPDGHGEGGVSVERRYQAFLEFLRAPLTRAEESLAEAVSKGKAKAQQARVNSLRRKYARLIAVLTALHESPQPSEEEIARRQGLTRNQVKYVVERVREEFTHFFPDLARETQGRRKRQGAGS